MQCEFISIKTSKLVLNCKQLFTVFIAVYFIYNILICIYPANTWGLNENYVTASMVPSISNIVLRNYSIFLIQTYKDDNYKNRQLHLDVVINVVACAPLHSWLAPLGSSLLLVVYPDWVEYYFSTDISAQHRQTQQLP